MGIENLLLDPGMQGSSLDNCQAAFTRQRQAYALHASYRDEHKTSLKENEK